MVVCKGFDVGRLAEPCFFMSAPRFHIHDRHGGIDVCGVATT